MLMQGVDAIEDKDFNVKFVSTGKYEMDKLISVYNRMIDELRTERTKQEQQHFFLEKLIHTSPVGILILIMREHSTGECKSIGSLLNTEERQSSTNRFMNYLILCCNIYNRFTLK
jgi:nitrogen fixation/metabolism regulation signal transduction histidine kinase